MVFAISIINKLSEPQIGADEMMSMIPKFLRKPPPCGGEHHENHLIIGICGSDNFLFLLEILLKLPYIFQNEYYFLGCPFLG